MTDTTTINFTVYVDINTKPNATYTYKDAQGQPSSGSPTVTVNNTDIVYTLGSSGLIFLQPNITEDTGGDLTPHISENKQILTIADTDIDAEIACLVLNVAETSNPTVAYPSPDPQIINRPD